MTDFLKRCGGFTPTPDVLIQKYKSPAVAQVWGVVWRYCQKTGERKLTFKQIADRAGVSERSAVNHVKLLVKDGFIEDKTPDIRNEGHVYSTANGEEKVMAMQNLHTSNEDGEQELHTSEDEGMQNLHSSYAENADLGMQNLHLIDSSKKDQDTNPIKPIGVEYDLEDHAPTQQDPLGPVDVSGILKILGDYRIKPDPALIQKDLGPIEAGDQLQNWVFQAANYCDCKGQMTWPKVVETVIEIALLGGWPQFQAKHPLPKDQPPNQDMFEAVRAACRLLKKLDRKTTQAVSGAVGVLVANGVSPGDLSGFADWWQHHDWRGHKDGKAPKPDEIPAEWGNYQAYLAGGKQNGHQNAAGNDTRGNRTGKPEVTSQAAQWEAENGERFRAAVARLTRC